MRICHDICTLANRKIATEDSAQVMRLSTVELLCVTLSMGLSTQLALRRFLGAVEDKEDAAELKVGQSGAPVRHPVTSLVRLKTKKIRPSSRSGKLPVACDLNIIFMSMTDNYPSKAMISLKSDSVSGIPMETLLINSQFIETAIIVILGCSVACCFLFFWFLCSILLPRSQEVYTFFKGAT